jgi:hypothetical protein
VKDEDRRSGGRNENQAQASRRAGLLAQHSMAYYQPDCDKKQLTKRCATTRLGPVCCLRPVCSRRIRALHQESPLDLRANNFELLFRPISAGWTSQAAWILHGPYKFWKFVCIVVSELRCGTYCTRPPIVNLKIGRGIHTCRNASPGKAQLHWSKLSNSATTFSSTSVPPNQERAGTAFSRLLFL